MSLKKNYFILSIIIFISCSCTKNGTEALSPPMGLKAISGNNQVILRWIEDADIDVTGYEIYFGTDESTLRLYDTVLGRTSTTITIKQLQNERTHFFKIRSISEKLGLKSLFTPTVSTVPRSETKSEKINIATWNLEWFYSPSRGPQNDEQQLKRVKSLIELFRFDMLGIQEISNSEQFERLATQLTKYRALQSLSSYQSTPQNVGVLYNTNLFSYISHKSLTSISENSGRPPLEVSFKKNDSSQMFYLIVIHAKANSETSSYKKRATFSKSLQSYIDNNHLNDYIILLGDFNDKLNGSITSGKQTPYNNFVSSNLYQKVTLSLNSPNQKEHSIPRYNNTIDHIIVTDEFSASAILTNTLNVLEEECLSVYSDYYKTVSDHVPVVISLSF